MSHAPPPSPDPSWTDEDVQQARRSANRRSAALALLVFIGMALLVVADDVAKRQGPQAGTACRIGAGVVFVVAFFVFFAAMSAWLNLVQRRGSRDPEHSDLI